MKVDKLKKRLQKDRPMVTITLRLPEDVVDDLKRVAPFKDVSSYQALIRAYVGQGLREDMVAMESLSGVQKVESKRTGDFFLNSPLRNSGVKIKRDKRTDLRKTEL